MSLASLMNQRCTIKKASFGSPGKDGQPVITYKTSLSKCRLVPGGGKEYRVQDQNTVAEYMLYLPGNAAITEKDQVLVDGILYDVRLVRNPSSMSHHLECILETVR